MVGKGSKAHLPGWKALLDAASNCASLNERFDLVKTFISDVEVALEEHALQPPGSQKLFAALGVGDLNKALSVLSPDSSTAYNQLLAVNDVLTGSDGRLALVLVEHQFLTHLTRLHQRIGNAASRLSQAVVMLLFSTTLMAATAPGGIPNLELVAAKPEVLELFISQLIFLSLNPAVLLSAGGVGTAQRCVQACWELTRMPSPHCKAVRELLVRIDVAARLILIAGTVVGRGAAGTLSGQEPEGGAAAAAAAALSGVAALAQGRQGSPDAAPGPAGSSASTSAGATSGAGSDNGGDQLFEERLALAAQAVSFVANLAGLGNRGIELSTAGLAPLRAWLLRPGTLAALKAPLEGLIDGLTELRRRIAAQGMEPDVTDAEAAAAAAEGEEADLQPGRLPRRKLLDQVEGAVRNLLMLLGLPTVVMGTNEEDVVEACGFVIRHSFGMYTEGYVDTMRALRSAVSDPLGPSGTSSSSAAAATPPGFTEAYPGDYSQFFRAYAGHMEMVAPALGVQLEDWGVRFTGEQAARDLPVMEVGDGVDARIAHSWLKGQIQDIINWGHTMMALIRMADQAKMGAQQQQQQRGPAGQQGVAAAAPADANCARCDAAPPAGGPPFQLCSRCRGVRYCSRACQVGHWAQHKVTCKVVPPPPAAQLERAAAASNTAAQAAPAATAAGEVAEGRTEGDAQAGAVSPAPESGAASPLTETGSAAIAGGQELSQGVA